ncbi:MAG: hypothetical protein FWG66_12240 [Spirochaetes bacterium]|nr:hypothetical protein [Spirochaetota bacterium]
MQEEVAAQAAKIANGISPAAEIWAILKETSEERKRDREEFAQRMKALEEAIEKRQKELLKIS